VDVLLCYKVTFKSIHIRECGKYVKVKTLVNVISGNDVFLCLLFLFHFLPLFLDVTVHLDDKIKKKRQAQTNQE